MKKSMQLKARIKEMAQKHQVPAQVVLQTFMMERILERIAVSKYRDMFILKPPIIDLDPVIQIKFDHRHKGS